MADDWGSFEIEGLEELDAKLAAMDNDLAGKALYGGLMTASLPMYKQIKNNAPVAAQTYRRYTGGGSFIMDDPGTLQDSVSRKRLTKGDAKRGSGATIGIVLKGKNVPGQDPFYWYWIENGKSGFPATPFIRPGFDDNVEVVTNRFAKFLAKRIDKYTE